MSRALGWASVGLGLPLLVRPAESTQAVGVGSSPKHRAAATLVGVREFAAAAGLLARPSSVWLWSRVAGDAMDLAMLGRAMKKSDGRGIRRTAVATAGVAAIAAVDLYAALTRSRKESAMEITGTTTIRTSPDELYAFWRQLDRLPTFMAHVDDVTTTGERTSHWKVSAPFGRTVEWDAEITDEDAGRSIAWKSVGTADVENEGVVRFNPAPRDQGTEIHATIRYSIPGGKLGEAVARYFGEDPHQQLDDDLRRLKQIVETGEVVRSEGAPGGKRARKEFPQHAAQPLTDDEYAAEVSA
ncbi:MAG: SRPBCC family protein [Jatrophihabitans sp.]|uniref:SRPBCC family protein n=1 Tax=Jatrophihabitans sp. TaxID=1932789 RepID=UPI0039155954